MNFDNKTIEQQLAICEAATPGPWSYFWSYYLLVVTPKRYSICKCNERCDALFIAAAREGYPAALREIQRLREELDGLRAAMAQAGETWKRENINEWHGTCEVKDHA